MRKIGLLAAARRGRSHESLALIMIAATLFASTTGCTTEPSDRRLTLDKNPSSRQSGGADKAPGSAPKSTAVTLGDLNPPPNPREVGSPYDPCDVVNWATFPTAVRPLDATTSKPTRRTPDKDDVYRVACVWDNSGKVVLNPSGQPPSENGGEFSVWVVWGPDDLMTADPTKIKDAQPATFGPAPGAIRPIAGNKGEPMCLTYAKLAKGIGSVSTLNSRFAGVDPCSISTAILTEIATKHG